MCRYHLGLSNGKKNDNRHRLVSFCTDIKLNMVSQKYKIILAERINALGRLAQTVGLSNIHWSHGSNERVRQKTLFTISRR